jgi:hypothetical protein
MIFENWRLPMLRIRTAVAIIVAPIAIFALGVEFMRRHHGAAAIQSVQLDSGRPAPILLRPRDPADTVPRSGREHEPPGPPNATSTVVSPPLSTPFEVPLPEEDSRSFGFFPAIGDLDGDGRTDLLAGTRRGRMRVHRGIGSTGPLQFAPPVWFDEFCPNGRIPTG